MRVVLRGPGLRGLVGLEEVREEGSIVMHKSPLFWIVLVVAAYFGYTYWKKHMGHQASGGGLS